MLSNPAASQSMRADARRNREKILSVALAAFTESGAGASLEGIARDAGVGIGTLYRHFPTREALIVEVYRQEVEQLGASAETLLKTLPPDQALNAWFDRAARYAITKRGLANAMSVANLGDHAKGVDVYGILVGALQRLLEAGISAGTIRSDLTPDDVFLSMSSLWRLNIDDDWQSQSRRLILLLMDGLRTHGTP